METMDLGDINSSNIINVPLWRVMVIMSEKCMCWGKGVYGSSLH